MNKYRLITSAAIAGALLATSPALAATKQTTPLESSAVVTAGTITSTASFSSRKTKVASKVSLAVSGKGKIVVSARSCSRPSGTCKGRTRSHDYKLSPGAKTVKPRFRLGASRRVLITVKSGSKVLARQSLKDGGAIGSIASKPGGGDPVNSDPGSDTGDSGESGIDQGGGSGGNNTGQPGGGSPLITDPSCRGYGPVDPSLGYALCNSWTTTGSIAPAQGEKITSGSIVMDMWRDSSTSNVINVRLTINTTATSATSIGARIRVCGDGSSPGCVDASVNDGSIPISAGSSSVVRNYTLSPSRVPLIAAASISSSSGFTISMLGRSLVGCRGPVDGCATG